MKIYNSKNFSYFIYDKFENILNSLKTSSVFFKLTHQNFLKIMFIYKIFIKIHRDYY